MVCVGTRRKYMHPMKTIITLLLLVVSAAFAQERIAVKVSDSTGKPIENAQVVAILKSGAYQDTTLENGEYVCSPTEQCVKVFAAAPGYEAMVKKYSGAAGTLAVSMKASDTKNSAVIRSAGELPGIDGRINPVLDNLKRLYLYTTKIGLEANGRPAPQPLKFALGRQIDAMDSTGKDFKMWVVDITPQVSVVEFTMPK